jgi:hypothetical protein
MITNKFVNEVQNELIENKFQLYREIANILEEKVDETLPLNIQWELYESKLSYLQNLLTQALKDANTQQIEFEIEDISALSKAIETTKEHQSSCAQKIVQNSFANLRVAS